VIPEQVPFISCTTASYKSRFPAALPVTEPNLQSHRSSLCLRHLSPGTSVVSSISRRVVYDTQRADSNFQTLLGDGELRLDEDVRWLYCRLQICNSKFQLGRIGPRCRESIFCTSMTTTASLFPDSPSCQTIFQRAVATRHSRTPESGESRPRGHRSGPTVRIP
jgi:hypothetical protein